MNGSDEDRASNVLTRLDSLGLGDGLVEADLLGGVVREPLRTCCIRLARFVWVLFSRNCENFDLIPLRSAVVAVHHAASSQLSSAHGKLDESLMQILHALQGSPNSPSLCSFLRLDAIELLISSVQASAILAYNQFSDSALDSEEVIRNAEEKFSTGSVDHAACEISNAIRGAAQACGINVHQPRSTAANIANQVRDRVQRLTQRLPNGFFDAILSSESLNEHQKAQLVEIDAALRAEYSLRRRVLQERAKVTLQAFSLSPRLIDEGTVHAAQVNREEHLLRMQPTPGVKMADVFTATLGDVIELTERATSCSGEGSRLHSSIKEVLIGSVPDRGGRIEGQSRVAGMPAWSARKGGLSKGLGSGSG